jgi:TIR domain
VCYAHDERKIVIEEIRWLRENGFDVWFDEAIEAGNRWSEDLARAVEGCAAVLFFLSPQSSTSRYCLDEIHFALECGRPIVPAEIEPTTLTPGLRLSLGGTHRIFMYRMHPVEFREKLASGLRAAIDGRSGLSMHAGPSSPVAHGAPAPAADAEAFNWRAVLVGALAALIAFAAILYA